MLNSAKRILLAGLMLLGGSMLFDLAHAAGPVVGKTYMAEFAVCNTADQSEEYIRNVVESGMNLEETQFDIGKDDDDKWHCGVSTWRYRFEGKEYELPDVGDGYAINKITLLGYVNQYGVLVIMPEGLVQYGFGLLTKQAEFDG